MSERSPLHISIFLMATLSSCDSKTTPAVAFVVPTGFRGVVLIQRDEFNGVDVRDIAGVYTCNLTASQILLVRSDEFLAQPHRPHATYADGSDIPHFSSVNPTSKSAVALHNVGNIGGGSRFYVIGTEADVAEAVPQIHALLAPDGHFPRGIALPKISDK